MNVEQLVTLLQAFPPEAPAGVLTVIPTGLVMDVETAPAITVEQTLADDGTVEAVWITGVGEATVAPPTLISWPCSCGQQLTVDQHSSWPTEHDEHRTDLRRQP